MLRICILIVAILLWPVSLSAADFRNRGAGATSCGTWTQEHREKSIKSPIARPLGLRVRHGNGIPSAEEKLQQSRQPRAHRVG
jgi:hypothetical protein